MADKLDYLLASIAVCLQLLVGGGGLIALGTQSSSNEAFAQLDGKLSEIETVSWKEILTTLADGLAMREAIYTARKTVWHDGSERSSIRQFWCCYLSAYI
ncbi:MAG: hypothetical protein ABI612_06505 [Betaproteobacteria bacterium]